ncbi:LysE family translocator [Kistimonas asteriae]|uniref:LysE family translocator n=1 Tax=Kistimonas asteriae TaxID=517724 RepID=UPI001BAA50D0|nr:LysE family translocator [Kistimonas asteriae]
MGMEQWLAFVSATLILFLIPGPDMVLVAGWSARKGFRMGLEAATGTVSGLLVHTTATAMGLAALLAASASAFTVLKWVGSIYLVWLGIMKLKNGEHTTSIDKPRRASSPFLQAFCTNLLNPKVILFFLAFLPHFVDPAIDVKVQFIQLGLAFTLLSSLCYLIFIAITVKAGEALGKSRRARQLGRWLSGTVMIGFGVRLAMASHQ